MLNSHSDSESHISEDMFFDDVAGCDRSAEDELGISYDPEPLQDLQQKNGINDDDTNSNQNSMKKYMYLGLGNKLKNWFTNKTMYVNMLGHWLEKEHWLENMESWPLKKEIWDGNRWSELQWFWNPEVFGLCQLDV